MEITITISDEDLICLNNDLMDVEEWVQDAVRGKISSCKNRMIKEWTPRLISDSSVSTIPASESELLNFIVSRDDYMNRKERENNKV